jgi:hypothetical protein
MFVIFLKIKGPLGQSELNRFSYQNVIDLMLDKNDLIVCKKTKTVTDYVLRNINRFDCY